MQLFRYPGSKANGRAQRQIKSFFPVSFKEYREPFVGSGAIYWTIPSTTPRWINDFNRNLIAVYEALKYRPGKFIELCREIPPADPEEPVLTKPSGARYPLRLLEKFKQFKLDDGMDPALRYLFLNRCAWNGRVILDQKRRHSSTHFSAPCGWCFKLFDKLAEAAEVVADTRIACSDFEELFNAPGDDVFIFADPPYVKDTELHKTRKLYEHGFTMDDHRRLRDCVRRCKHDVMITYDDHSTIRELYKEFFINDASWIYMGRADRKLGRELIITNYPSLQPSASVAEITAPTLQLVLPASTDGISRVEIAA